MEVVFPGSELTCLQILPRYIIHFRDLEAEKARSDNPTSAAAAAAASPNPKITSDMLVILWLDPDRHQTTERQAAAMVARAADSTPSRRVAVFYASSSAEARAWLEQNGPELARTAKKRLRIITNRYRKDDGDELAGAQRIGE